MARDWHGGPSRNRIDEKRPRGGGPQKHRCSLNGTISSIPTDRPRNRTLINSSSQQHTSGMPSFFSRFNSSKSGKDRSAGSSRTKPATDPLGSRSDDTPAKLLPLELPSSSLLADTSRANPHFLSTPVRQLSFHSAHKLADDDRGEQSDLRSLRSSEGGGSPWVAVDAENTPRTIRKGSFVAGGGGSAKVGFPELADPERERREQARLERARLTVEDVTLLSEECGDVIRSRGASGQPCVRGEAPQQQLTRPRPPFRSDLLGSLPSVSSFRVSRPDPQTRITLPRLRRRV
jgi:hypothetical protein